MYWETERLARRKHGRCSIRAATAARVWPTPALPHYSSTHYTTMAIAKGGVPPKKIMPLSERCAFSFAVPRWRILTEVWIRVCLEQRCLH